MPDKTVEREVLGSVYAFGSYEIIDEGERPDFVLAEPGAAPFGVEVTEFFQSASHARISKIAGYVSHLTSGGAHRHRDDVSALPVRTMTVTSADGQPKGTFPVIFGQSLPVSDCLEGIAGRIEAKGQLFSSYRDGLSHINLMVRDFSLSVRGLTREDLSALIVKSRLGSVAARSPFREIFLLTSEGEDGWIFFPLRLIVLISELYFFNTALVEIYEKNRELWPAEADKGELFSWHLNSLGCRSIYRPQAEGLEVMFGNSGVKVEAGEIAIRDFAERPLQDGELPRQPPEDFWRMFEVVHKRIALENVFSSAIAYPLRPSRDGGDL